MQLSCSLLREQRIQSTTRGSACPSVRRVGALQVRWGEWTESIICTAKLQSNDHARRTRTRHCKDCVAVSTVSEWCGPHDAPGIQEGKKEELSLARVRRERDILTATMRRGASVPCRGIEGVMLYRVCGEFREEDWERKVGVTLHAGAVGEPSSHKDGFLGFTHIYT